MRIRNTFIIFLVSGFWHGANWTFIVWGLLHAIYILPSIVFKTNRNNLDIVAKGKLLPSVRELFDMILTFVLAVFAWIFFRAEDLSHATDYIHRMIFSDALFSIPEIRPRILLGLLIFFMIIEWLGRESDYAIEKVGIKVPKIFRWLFYYLLVFMILYCAGSEQKFIYFQF